METNYKPRWIVLLVLPLIMGGLLIGCLIQSWQEFRVKPTIGLVNLEYSKRSVQDGGLEYWLNRAEIPREKQQAVFLARRQGHLFFQEGIGWLIQPCLCCGVPSNYFLVPDPFSGNERHEFCALLFIVGLFLAVFLGFREWFVFLDNVRQKYGSQPDSRPV